MGSDAVLILVVVTLILILGLQMASRQQAIQLKRLERKLDALLLKLEVNLNAEVDPEVIQLAQAGRKIDAIKKHRARTGASLKDAKDFVERL